MGKGRAGVHGTARVGASSWLLLILGVVLIMTLGAVPPGATGVAPLRRLEEHVRTPPGPWRGMQVISEALPLAQAEALETSLIQQAIAEGRIIYNVKPLSISPLAPVRIPSTIAPQQSFLNYRIYPH